MTEEAARWLSKAGEDLETSRYLLQGEYVGQAAFFAQQAAEKAFKAVLVAREGRFTKIHNLVSLASEAKAPDILREKCESLTPAYVAYRYPDVENPITPPEAEMLVKIAAEVVAWARRQLS